MTQLRGQGMMPDERDASTQKLNSIQVLRAVAALAVTLAHTNAETGWLGVYTGRPDHLPGMVTGAAGVDLFFVISGFVMVYASEPFFGSARGAMAFLWRRIIRIVPMYWLATTVTLAYWLWVLGTSLAQESLPPDALAASYFFIPHMRPNGTMAPALGVGWSLNYEMFFYLTFAAFIVFPRRAAVIGLGFFLAGFVYFGSAAFLPEPLAYFSNSTLLEFLFGMAVGLAYREGISCPPQLAWLIGAVGLTVLGATAISDRAMIFRREIMWGGASALIVIAALWAIELARPGGRLWRFLVLIGNASYALYLLHGVVMLMPRTQFLDGAVWLYQWPWLYVAFLVSASVAVAVAVHLLIENPMTNRLRRRATDGTIKRRAAAHPSVAAIGRATLAEIGKPP
jgi:exopolysaccharide production protein ExoZ